MNNSTRAPLRRVSVHTIREELHRLWASEAMAGEAVIRARTHNLIVYVADDVSAEETTQRVIESTAERPGRVVVIDVDPDRSDSLDAWVTTYCRTVNHHQVCGELITLTVGKAQQEEIHSTVISLLAPELPVFLWWMGIPDPEDHLFARLAPSADRVIVDSVSFSSPPSGLAVLAELQHKFRLSDLAWARLTPWRKLMAHVWDVRDLQTALNFVRVLDIQYASDGDSWFPNRALLLMGWLADRLGWEITQAVSKSQGRYSLRWKANGCVGRARLEAQPNSGVSPGEIVKVTVKAGHKTPYGTSVLQLRPELEIVHAGVDAGGPSALNYSARFAPIDTASALAEDLDIGYDPSYSGALHAAGTILDLARTH